MIVIISIGQRYKIELQEQVQIYNQRILKKEREENLEMFQIQQRRTYSQGL